MSVVLKLTREFEQVKQQATAAYISVGMITGPMFEYFMRGLQHCREISILTGIQMPTQPEVLERLYELTIAQRIRSGIYIDNYFHPKVYCFKLADGWRAFVGSGNFTNGGWHANEELFLKITDPEVCEALREQHTTWMTQAIQIDKQLVEKYKDSYSRGTPRRNEERKSVKQLIDAVKNKFNIDNVDFSEQFFTKEDHLTFLTGKTQLDTPDVLMERTRVRNKLLKLNDMLKPNLPVEWDIHPHYITEHLAAHIYTEFHHEDNVRLLWLAYGRSKEALKKYGEIDTTPLNFMRMQVIIGFDYIGIWLMPGKSGGGRIDREYLRQQMNNPEYREQFFNCLKSLGKDYWIEIATIDKDILEFKDPSELYEFIQKDNWRYYYFTIGRNYLPGYEDMKSDRIVNTVVRDFEKMLPLYNLIKDTSMD